MNDLYDFADALNVEIVYCHLPRDRDGDYSAKSNTIRLQQGMTYRLHRHTLAHELAHAVFGDVPTLFGPVNAKQERRADEWAALRLIDPAGYRAAEDIHGSHPPALAQELNVVTRTIETYQRILARIGDTVYLRPRMGAGQWALKEQVA